MSDKIKIIAIMLVTISIIMLSYTLFRSEEVKENATENKNLYQN